MQRMRITATKVGGALAAALLLAGCLKTEEFPPEPRIEFKSFQIYNVYNPDLGTWVDSASLVISFTDGDGDIGLTNADSLPPYDCNLRLEYYEFENGVWTNPDLGTSPYICERVPIIRPTGQNKTLEGEIAVAMMDFEFFHLPGADSIRYSAVLVDRALHESNSVETGLILVP